MLSARPDATLQLTQAQAEAMMLNAWPPPPIGDNQASEPLLRSATVALAAVRLSPDVHRLKADLPTDLGLAWVATWSTPDGPAACSTRPGGGYSAADGVERLRAFVLAADGSVAYDYTGPSKSCDVQHLGPEYTNARAQQAVNRISLPWTGDRRDKNGDVLMTFQRAACAGAGGQVDDSNQASNFAVIPVGRSCTGTVQDSIRTGPVAPKRHPLLGPVRFVNGRVLPALPIPPG